MNFKLNIVHPQKKSQATSEDIRLYYNRLPQNPEEWDYVIANCGNNKLVLSSEGSLEFDLEDNYFILGAQVYLYALVKKNKANVASSEKDTCKLNTSFIRNRVNWDSSGCEWFSNKSVETVSGREYYVTYVLSISCDIANLGKRYFVITNSGSGVPSGFADAKELNTLVIPQIFIHIG